MPKIWKYFGIGLLVAFGGLFFASHIGSVFNGMEYGNACAVGIGIYLCVVVVTCTGIIVSRIDTGADKKNSDGNKES